MFQRFYSHLVRILFIFSCSCSALFALSPRLLIQLGPDCNFTARDLQKKIDIIIIPKPEKPLAETIHQLDRSSSHHVLLIEGNNHNLENLSKKIGYEYIYVNENFEKAVASIQSILPTIPLTDAELPRVDPHTVGQFYALTMQVDTLFSKHNLRYWATCGTLLGMVRHGGMIPWDDDVDVAILDEDSLFLESLKEELNKIGLELYHWKEACFYKIFPINGLSIKKENSNEFYPWKYPFIDVFPLIQINGKLRFKSKKWRQNYPNDFVFPQKKPLVRLPFGPLSLPAPDGYIEYLYREFGDDWNDVAYVVYNHQLEKKVKKIKVDLLDRSPPKYILPISN